MRGIIDSHYFVNKSHVHGEYLILMFHYNKELCMTRNMLNLKPKKASCDFEFIRHDWFVNQNQINLLFWVNLGKEIMELRT